jgi:tetratricopeptide (TPR) repeat protein
VRTVRQACLVLGFLGIPGSALALEFPATVIAGANSIDGPINFGVGPEQLHALFRHKAKDLEALIAAHNDTIALLKEKLEINEQQIRAALLAAGEKEVPPERLAATLAEIGERYRILRAPMTRDTDDGPEVARLKDRADKAIDAGELALADNLLARIQDLQRRSAVARAHIRARRGDVALAGLHYREAAGHFGAAAADVLPGHGDLRLAYLEQEANALFRQGEAFGDSLALNTAIERFRSLLVLRPHDRMPLDWAMTQNSLGLALTTLGTRENGTARLEQAITAFREALKERTRERAPLDWAETQNDLALALKTLGARESGAARLEQAVAAYREALKEWSRERAPLDWAMKFRREG